MDYELKRVIAICLIVKLVALSSEFSIRPQTEMLSQGSDTVQAKQLTSLAVVKEPRATSTDKKNQGMHFNLGPGGNKSSDIRKFNKKLIRKSGQVRINSAFDTCEHMAELLESSKWRDIQKTLHWLDRVFASSNNNVRSCRRKSGKMKRKLGVINKKLSFYSPKTNSKGESFFEMKKFPDTLIMNCRQHLINSLTSHNNSEQIEKLKKECGRKYKLGKNKLKHLYQKKSRRKTKNRKYFRKKNLEKHREYFSDRPTKPNNTITESNSLFSDSEKLYYAKKKNEIENFQGEKFPDLKSSFENAMKIYKNMEEGTDQELGRKEKKLSERWPVTLELRKSDGKNNYKKENPWPNFVYHRVSSDLFRLGSSGSNHKQSAYVAISVNTSGEPDAVKNKNKIFGL